ncbi:LLM class flavin-dependent oxidoreductase [Candidatus Parcubacteria bacterium]|nr:MAG: LLM class flavin-dependent oxidoreductase [Candidatus Parcubacteria bacterium]
MKVCWFHLMPYPYLPDDFKQKYRSVWVDVPSQLYDPEKGHWVYNEYLDELEFADQMGFDGICVNEHHANAYGMMPSPNLMLAALVRRTAQAALIVLGNSIALYNPPIRVAEEFAMLDVMSGGRFIAGFPVGSSMDTNFAYGATPATLREKYQEAHDLIIKAWTHPEPFAFNGKYTQLRYVNIWPRPLQKPFPPVWVPGGGCSETWDWVLERDYMYSYLSYFGFKHGRRVMQGFWEAVARKGVDPNPYRAGFLQLVAISDTDAKAEAEYAAHADYFYNRCLHVFEGFADAPGYRTLATLRRGFRPQVGARAMRIREGLTWKDFVEQGYIIGGSPATVRDRLKEVARELHIGHLMVLCHFGNMPKERVQQNTELFAQYVLPELHTLWSEWDDHWWPRPLPTRAQPTALPTTHN